MIDRRRAPLTPDELLVDAVLKHARREGAAALERARAELEQLRAIDPAAAEQLEAEHPELRRS